MSMQVKPGYINPLSMMENKHKLGQTPTNDLQTGKDKVSELQAKQQALQNQMLLMKASGTDSSTASEQMQQELEQALNEVAQELSAVKNSSAVVTTGEISPLERLRGSAGSKVDFYEKGAYEAPSPGIYRVERDEEGYSILFSPCAED